MRRTLFVGTQAGDDTHALRVGLVAQALHHRAARHLGHVCRWHVHEVGPAVDQLGGQSLVVLGLVDGAGGQHALQHPLLALARGGFVDDGVGVDGVVLQACQQGGFGQVDLLQRLAEVDLRARAITVGALAQVDLVAVELQDLVLAQFTLQLPGDQCFLDLAFGRAPGAEEEGARHLLRDGAGTAAHAAAQVRQPGACDAAPADGAVFIEVGVFHRQHGLLEQGRRVLQGDVDAALGAELGDLHAVGREHLQVLVRAVVGGLVQAGQFVPVPGSGDGQGQHNDGGQRRQHQQDAAQDDEAAGAALCKAWRQARLSRSTQTRRCRRRCPSPA